MNKFQINNMKELSFESLPDYNSVVDYLKKKNRTRHLLLGNGFSMAYDKDIFSYNALFNFIQNLKDQTLSKVFKAINTKNFELVMQQLDNFIEIAISLNADKGFIDQLKDSHNSLQNSLIDSIKELHPEHVFTIPEEKSKHCFNFLDGFISSNGKVFTTNYDLLLYWVLMRNKAKGAVDGFGREIVNPEAYQEGEEFQYSELIWGKYKKEQSVYYIHGTLPFFDNGIDIIKEEYTSDHYILENIKSRLDKKEYPIFVTAGNGEEKLAHIMHNKYLTHCYEELCNVQGSLITFGFNFGEYDEHIIDAINRASKYGLKSGDKLFSVYIGVYTKKDFEHIQSIKKKFLCKVNLYNAQTAKIWV
ncbi:MAG: DUF4917 family protein [Fulvivirga sp.]|uniref:DUF4917 family protein n=1 Tax=Fulvivirga sp. TaxID=1931237 RepID=UPI0032EBF48D